ncbi:MAG: ribosomal protein L7/L12 [Myxococcales bacterium]|nr:ribosomal protein L7/L12 [Myxococcales bacterium]
MILGTEIKSAGRRLARYVAGLVLVVLERDGALTAKALEPAVAAAFDAHGLKLAQDAKCPTATAAAARWVSTVCRELCGAGFIHNVSAGAERWVLNAKRVRFDSPADAADALNVGRTSVRRWVRRGIAQEHPVSRLVNGRRKSLCLVEAWRSGGAAYHHFPARAPLPKQGELELPAGSPTDDDLARAEAASVNMVEPETPNTDAAGPFDVVLLSAGQRKILAIKTFMDVSNPRPNLRTARSVVESAPVIVRRSVTGVIANAVAAEFARIGASVEIVKAGTWSPPVASKPATPWTVTTCETARFEVDNVRVVAERGGERPTVGYEPDDAGFCLCDADPATVLRYARMLEAAALWALGES